MTTNTRVISTEPASPNEESVERALRPQRLAEYVGQRKIREQLGKPLEYLREPLLVHPCLAAYALQQRYAAAVRADGDRCLRQAGGCVASLPAAAGKFPAGSFGMIAARAPGHDSGGRRLGLTPRTIISFQESL